MALEHEDENEGMSTSKKVVAGAAVGVAIPAAVGVAKKMLGDDSGDEDESAGNENVGQRGSRTGGSRSRASRSSGSSGRSRSGTSSRTRPSGRTRSTSKSRSSARSRRTSSSSGSGRTKEQLYATAKRLNIDGRSKMSKQQLERAIARARG